MDGAVQTILGSMEKKENIRYTMITEIQADNIRVQQAVHNTMFSVAVLLKWRPHTYNITTDDVYV